MEFVVRARVVTRHDAPLSLSLLKGDAGVLLVSKTALEPAIGPLALPSPEAGIGAHPHLGQSGPRLGLPGLSQKRALGAGNAEAA